MIVVLDTNVLISALLSPTGTPADIIRRWEAEAFEVAISPALLAEVERVLTYPRVSNYLTFSPTDIAAFLKRLRSVAKVVDPLMTLTVIKANPADDRMLECALAGGAEYIVSGNAHLLDLKEYRQIVILRPVDFPAVLS